MGVDFPKGNTACINPLKEWTIFPKGSDICVDFQWWMPKASDTHFSRERNRKKNKTICYIMPKKLKNNDTMNVFYNMFQYLNNNVHALNNSKIFAGLMIVTLNISSKFVTFKLSKSVESYLKYTFSRDLLLFTIAWIGTRDIYTALVITIIFLIVLDFLLNEQSIFCCLPRNFTDYHISLLDKQDKVTEEDIRNAKNVLEKAKIHKQKNEQAENGGFSSISNYTDTM